MDVSGRNRREQGFQRGNEKKNSQAEHSVILSINSSVSVSSTLSGKYVPDIFYPNMSYIRPDSFYLLHPCSRLWLVFYALDPAYELPFDDNCFATSARRLPWAKQSCFSS